MTVAVVVVAPGSVVNAAEDWARLGLVGDSLWVSADDLTSIDPDAPNALTAIYLRFEQDPLIGPLAVQLAELGSLDEARITWLRGTDATNAGLLRALDSLARELLPYDQIHWLDIVVPQRRTDETAAPLAGDWTQFRIHPSDRPAPDVADAGWDLGLAVPLHVTLALTGILGGTTTMLPWARLNAAQNWVVRVFSRLVDGGLEARRQSWHFVLETLPTTHAAEQHPSTFLPSSGAEAGQIVEEATDWVMASHGRTLDYGEPATSEFQPHPRLTVGQHLRNFLRFLPLGLQALLGIHREPNVVVGNVLEFQDLGYNVGKRIEVLPWTDGIPDYGAMEEAAAAQARQALDRLRAREGAQPSAEVWEPLAQIATSLVDCGSSLPEGWIAPIRHEQRVSLAPASVFLGPSETVLSVTPELALAENLAVAAEALTYTRANPAPPLGVTADPTGVTATAMILARSGNEQDAAALSRQLADLDIPQVPVSRPRSLLEHIRGRVIGGLLRSRLDAERWSAAATRSPDGPAPTWEPRARKFRLIWWIAIGVIFGLGVIWYFFHDNINAAIGTTIELGIGLAIVGALLLIFAIVLLYFFFRTWSAFLEKGRRRLELMALWLGRAQQAVISNAALLNTERTSRAWADLLSSALMAGDPEATESNGIEVERAPFSMRVGHPRFRNEQWDKWLATAGAQPGWRLASLSRIVAEFLACQPNRALQQLANDPALPGGKLDQLSAHLPELADDWRRGAVAQIWTDLRDHISVNVDRLDVPRSQGQPAQATRIGPFLAELIPDDGEQPWAHDHLVPAVTAPPSSDSALVLVMSAALSTAQIRIQVQALDNFALLDPPGPGDLDVDDGLPR